MRLLLALLLVTALLSVTFAHNEGTLDGDDRIIYDVIPADAYDMEDEAAHFARNSDVGTQCVGDLAALYLADACGKPACSYIHYVGGRAKPAIVNKNSPICSDPIQTSPPWQNGVTISSWMHGTTRSKALVYFWNRLTTNVYKINPITGVASVFAKMPPSPFMPLYMYIEVRDNATYLAIWTHGDTWEADLSFPTVQWQQSNYYWNFYDRFGSPTVDSRIAYSAPSSIDPVLYWITGYGPNPDAPIQLTAFARYRDNQPLYWGALPVADFPKKPLAMFWNAAKKMLLLVDVSNNLWWVDARISYGLDIRPPTIPTSSYYKFFTLPFGANTAVAFGANAGPNGLIANILYASSAQYTVAVDVINGKLLWKGVLNGTNISGPINNIW